MSVSNAIRLKGMPRHEEAQANEVLSPGHLLEKLATGKVQKCTVVGGVVQVNVASEDALQGRTIADAYAIDDQVMFWVAHKGDELQLLLKDGANVAIGDDLYSLGDGTVGPVASLPSAGAAGHIVAKANETLDLTAAGADTLCAVIVQ